MSAYLWVHLDSLATAHSHVVQIPQFDFLEGVHIQTILGVDPWSMDVHLYLQLSVQVTLLYIEAATCTRKHQVDNLPKPIQLGISPHIRPSLKHVAAVVVENIKEYPRREHRQ